MIKNENLEETVKDQYFEAISKLKPDILKSTYIIPFEHNFHDSEYLKQSNPISAIKSVEWEILNNDAKVINEETKEKQTTLYLHDIKKYLTNSLLPDFPDTQSEQVSFIKNEKALLLKNISLTKLEFNFIDRDEKSRIFKLNIENIYLWILDDKIAFFTLNIESTDKVFTLEEYSIFINRNLRDVKTLFARIDNDKLYISNKEGNSFKKSLFSILLDLTRKNYEEKNDSFLNIKTICDKNTIYNSTYYAKMLTSVYINKETINIKDKEFNIVNNRETLTEETNTDFNYFDELPYLLATTSSINTSNDPMFIPHRSYIYDHLENNSIQIWKYWIGIALQDSCAFISIKNGGPNIVNSNTTTNYFLYIMSLFSNIKLKIYETEVIDDEFINIHKIYPLKRKLQKLKNQYIAQEISIKFQPNIIYKQMIKGLNNEAILEEVSENIETTLDLTKQNTDALVSAGAVVFALGSFWEPIYNGITNYPILTGIALIGSLSLLVYGIYNRSKIIKSFEGIGKWISSKVN